MTATAETSRRALLLGVAGGLAALVAQALGRPAPVHAEGQAIEVGGEYLDATSRTFIRNATNQETVILGQSTGGGWGVQGISGSSWGVVGGSGSGVGVTGDSVTGIGGFFSSGGERAQLMLNPKQTAGKPTSGTHEKGEFYLDSNARLYVCSAAGTPGTWKKVSMKLA